MLCKKMVESRGVIHPCGQCVFCRINRKREWIARLLLEAASHQSNQFWTLTYDEENLPRTLGPGTTVRQSTRSIQQSSRRNEICAASLQPGTLFKPDLEKFFKRIRRNFGQFRYYAIGEYGERLGRPHFHVLAFGIELSLESLQETWGHGQCHIGNVEQASINYCIEYSLKSEKSDQLIDLRRIPEYSVMSRNPGIGAYALSEFRQAIMKSQPLPTGELLIPDTFKLLGKEYPVPRFIRNMLEDEGFVSSSSAARRYWKDIEVVSALLARSKVAKMEFETIQALMSDDPVTESDIRNQVRQQKILNAENRQRIFGKRHETL